MSKVTFDPINKLININSGETSLDVGIDLYSDWKEWLLMDDNAKWEAAFRTFGGDPTSEEQTAPAYFFLINGWKVLADQVEVVIQTNLYSDDGLSPFVVNNAAVTNRTSDAHIVKPEVEKRLDYGDRVYLDSTTPYVGTTYPNGTIAQPVNNLADAIAVANLYNITKIYTRTDTTLNNSYNLRDFDLYGDKNNIVITSVVTSSVLEDTRFYDLTVRGSFGNAYTAFHSCSVDTALTNINGELINCEISANVLVNKEMVISNCYSGIAGANSGLYLDMNPINETEVSIRSYSGGINVSNCNQTGDTATIELIAGKITFDTTCTDGTLDVRGVGYLVDNSNGTTIITDGFVDRITQRVEEINERLAYGDVVTIDIIGGQSGTTFPIGTLEYPVNNMTDALTIAENNEFITFELRSDLTITTGENVSHYGFKSKNHSHISLEPGVITDYTNFYNITLDGQFGGYTILNGSTISSSGVTNFYGSMTDCVFNGNIEISSDNTKNAVMLNCFTGNVSGPPVVDCGGDGAKISLRGLTGAFLFTNKTATTTPMFIDLYSARVGFDSAMTAGTITVRGIGYIYLDDSSNVTFDLQGLISKSTISVAVWDEILTKTTHNLPNSAGRKLRALSSDILLEDDVASATINTVTLQGASIVDGAYDPALITITDGLGVGQTRMILEYSGSTMTAVVDRNWKVVPDNTSVFLISASAGREHVNEGLAQSGTTNTITLNALASDIDDIYNGQVIFIRSGTGGDQANRVISYNGTTKVATMVDNWGIIPDNNSAYVMLPTGKLIESDLADLIWETTPSGSTVSSGQLLIDISGTTIATENNTILISEQLTGLTEDVNILTEITTEISGVSYEIYDNVVSISGETHEINQIVQDISIQISGITDSVTGITEQLDEMTDILVEISGISYEINDNVLGVSNQVSGVTDQLIDMDMKLDYISGTTYEMNENVLIMTDDVNEMSIQVSGMTIAISGMTESVDAMDAKLDYISGTTHEMNENVLIMTEQVSGMTESVDEMTIAVNNMTDDVKRILGLTQENFAITDHVYDPITNTLLSATIKIYSSSINLDNDIPFETYNMSAVYDASGCLTNYKVRRN